MLVFLQNRRQQLATETNSGDISRKCVSEGKRWRDVKDDQTRGGDLFCTDRPSKDGESDFLPRSMSNVEFLSSSPPPQEKETSRGEPHHMVF